MSSNPFTKQLSKNKFSRKHECDIVLISISQAKPLLVQSEGQFVDKSEKNKGVLMVVNVTHWSSEHHGRSLSSVETEKQDWRSILLFFCLRRPSRVITTGYHPSTQSQVYGLISPSG